MSDNASSAELVTSIALSHSKTATVTDVHLGALRHEVVRDMDNQAQFTWEKNMREAAQLEIGRSRNIHRVV
ncbi:MAG: hypothetical protein LBR53_13340 [Deltaproteobacteria bacterium]|jgi:hypothetical protein|nr:hypothetical protein [Deltaproteobacteria bacterium]